MCTILVARRHHRRFPLVIAANRDEVTARPATAPMLLDPGHDVWGGRDLLGGGTWLGVTGGRFFVAVTNQRTHRWPDRSRASRGELVMELLRAHDLDGACARLEGVPPATYNEANLLFGTADALRVAYLRDGAPTRIEPAPDGVSVLTNGELGDRAHFPKIARLETLVRQPWPDDVESLASMLGRALGDHERPPLDSIAPPPEGSIFSHELLAELHALCIHTEGYGTVSANVLCFGPDGALAHWLHAAGPPCRTPLLPIAR
jgi:uncharacterized protein with NRDE domain